MEIIYRTLSHTDMSLSQVEQLYESAFPADERRDFSDFVALLATDNTPFAVIGAFDGDTLLAFLSYWQLDCKVVYGEHFAVIPQMRGQGLGRTMLTHFLDNVSSDMVLEVEPPIEPIAVRRVKFYETLGFKFHGDFSYTQPPYGPGKSELPMKLMTHGHVSPQQLVGAVAEIRVKVYGCKPQPSAE